MTNNTITDHDEGSDGDDDNNYKMITEMCIKLWLVQLINFFNS